MHTVYTVLYNFIYHLFYICICMYTVNIYMCVCMRRHIYIYAVILQMLVVFTMLFFVDKCTVVQRVTREIQKEYITKMQFLIEKSCSNASQKWDLKLGLDPVTGSTDINGWIRCDTNGPHQPCQLANNNYVVNRSTQCHEHP